MIDLVQTTPTAQARQLLESGKFRILSLDIFDTTVWRTFPAPTDLFYALGHRLRAQGRLYSSNSPASFAAERVEAEQESRKKFGQNGEVTLEEIYRCFAPGYLRSCSVQDVLKEELALERESTFADCEVVALIDRAVELGIQIAFVSDTYFSEEHLRAILPRKSKYLLASCAFRRAKVHGLHTELSRKSGVKTSQILHVGDNLEADVKAPAALGVTTIWRPRFPSPYHEVVSTELPTTRSERAELFGHPAGDGGLSAVRAQAVTVAENWNDPMRAWGALFLGPVMDGFGKWVAERCRAEGIDTAMCLMREGKILKRVLDEGERGLKAGEFYVSRYALIRASIFAGDIPELVRYLARPQPPSAKDLLGPLGIETEEVELTDDMLVPAESSHEVALKIATNPGLRAKARRASEEARKNFLRYLRKTLPELPDRIAVVDLGYAGTIQACMQAIFDHEKIPCRTHGLYFVTSTGIRKIQAKGICAEGFLAENGQPVAIAHSFIRSPELIEQCLMCNLGSTLGYDENGVPTLGEQHLPEWQLDEIERVQAGLLDFVKLAAANKALRAADSSVLRPFLEAILVRSLTRPIAAELEAFGNWVHDENLGSSNTRKLIGGPLDSDYLSHASAHQLASLSNAASYWIFGEAHAQHPAIGEAVRSIFLRKTEPAAFQCPEMERTLHFFWNDGQAHRADGKYTLSSRRTAWSRFTLDVRQSALKEVGFAVGQPGDVISVSGIVLRLHAQGKPVEVIRLPLSELQTFGMEHVKGSKATYFVTELAGFAAAIESMEEFTGRVEIDFLFSQLPTGEPCLS